MRALDLFCGAGGAAMGLHRAGFEVVGVDIKAQPHYPFPFIQGDALQADLNGYDLVWASPPCQGYIQRNKNLVTKHPKLIEPVREKLVASGLPYIIENVPGAPLILPLMLCGTMFGLLLLRHRIFESNMVWFCEHKCNHWGTVADGDFAAVYAFGGKGRRHGRDAAGNRLRDPGSKAGPDWSVAMGIDWMTGPELSQAIPPAYSEFLGRQIISTLRSRTLATYEQVVEPEMDDKRVAGVGVHVSTLFKNNPGNQ